MKWELSEKQTLSIGPDDDSGPMFSLLKGHVDAETFSKAFELEGWESDPYSDDDLKHEYWKTTRSGFIKCEKVDPNAVAVTVCDW